MIPGLFDSTVDVGPPPGRTVTQLSLTDSKLSHVSFLLGSLSVSSKEGKSMIGPDWDKSRTLVRSGPYRSRHTDICLFRLKITVVNSCDYIDTDFGIRKIKSQIIELYKIERKKKKN